MAEKLLSKSPISYCANMSIFNLVINFTFEYLKYTCTFHIQSKDKKLTYSKA